MAEKKKLYPNYDMGVWFRTSEQEVEKPLEGKLKGTIPSWLNGTLLRNGAGCKKIGDSEYQHVFDGLALIHRFSLKGGRATYQCKFLQSETYKKNTAANRIVVSEFGSAAVPDPCRTVFDKISSMFNFNFDLTDNALVSVYPFGDQVYAMTEVPTLYKIDPESLETLDKESLSMLLVVHHTAHPHVTSNGDVYNAGLSVHKGYVIVKFSNNGNGNMFETAQIVGSVKPKWRLNPSYMHSFGLSENYFIIIEQPLCISLTRIVRRVTVGESISAALVSYPEYETEVILIHRETGATSRHATATLYYMHIVNCFEQDGNVMIDVCAYNDGKYIDAMYLDSIKSMQSNPDYSKWTHCRPKRITVPLNAPPTAKVGVTTLADVGVETPRINYELYNGRPYKYFYGIGSEVHTENAGTLIKVDVETGVYKIWTEPDSYPGEPVFIPHPDAKEEDDGVILSSVLWGKDDRKIALMVLNAKSFEEIARVEFATPSPAPRCFHGWYLPD